jgi:hypothetical protein
MKHHLSFTLGVVLLMAMVAFPAFSATLTNVWDFFTPSQYVVSDPTKIEVADGVAKLILQKTPLYQTSVPDYITNTSEQIGVGVGSDVSVCLSKAGSQYASYGEFESRVFDGGTNNNIWQAMMLKSFNQVMQPSVSGELTPSLSNMVALYHFNNSLVDEVTATPGILVNGASFTTSRCLGSHAVSCKPGYFQTANATLLNGKSEFSLLCWVNLKSYSINAGIVASRGSSDFIGILTGDISGDNRQRIQPFIWTSAGLVFMGVSATKLETNTWYHLALVRTAAGINRLYINGAVELSVQQYAGSPLKQSDYFKVGLDDVDPARNLDGNVDEVAIFDRSLSADEIKDVYQKTVALGYRVRSGNSNILSGEYVGPDGTPNTFFIRPYEALISGGNFNTGDRYVQYKATFASDQIKTPYLDAMRIVGSLVNATDDALGGFLRGGYTSATTNIPAIQETPYLSLSKSINGGFPTNGTYTSRVWDAGGSVTWNQIMWNAGGIEFLASIGGLEGLWHMNETWSDASGKGHASSPSGTVAFSQFAKLGTHSALFNGLDTMVDIGSMGVTLKTVEWWMNTHATDYGIMELSPTQVWFAVSNNMVWVGGTSATGATVYVNGGTQPALMPGWNHVAVTLPSGISNTAIVVGRAKGIYFEGAMDELAMFSTTFSRPEIVEHYVMGRQPVAGQVRFQARADNNNPPQTPYVGGLDTIGSYFVDASGANLPNSFVGKRYFQYRAYLEGDGNTTPALNSVTARYAGSSLITDDTRAKFSQGSYDGTGTEWTGDAVSRDSVQGLSPAMIDPQLSIGLMTLWHMDDAAWVYSIPSVKDGSANGRNGTPVGTVSLNTRAKVGVSAAAFLTNGYITASGGSLGADNFSVSMWWSSAMTGRCALATTYASPTTPYYALELNPSNAPAGSVAFILSVDGSTIYRAISFRAGWADGLWHHVSGVKQGKRIYLYLDGILEASSVLATANINLGTVLVTLGKYGSQNIYFTGMMDEVATYNRALEEWEISELAAAGRNTRGQGALISPIMDIGQVAYWEQLSWVPDAPYGKAHQPEQGSLVGLWHMDAITNTVLGLTTVDDSGEGHPAVVEGDGSVSLAGRFGSCLVLTGGVQRVRVADAAELALNSLSWETWVRLETEANATIIDKWSGGTGVRIGTDVAGRPYFQVGSTLCTAVYPLRIQQWYHLAGTIDGTYACLYVNGILRGRRIVSTENPVAAVDALLGGCGLMDEVALYNRPLKSEEVMDHYKAGALTLGLQVRAWDAGDPGDFVGSDGTVNTLFTASSGSLLSGVISLNRYFQYRAVFATEDATLTPQLHGVRVDVSAYPTDNPWVMPASSYGSSFPGNLLAFMDVLATNNNLSEVHYQISGNNGSNWYAWVDNQWTDVTLFTDPVSSWNMSSTRDVINANITSFYEQLYPKIGGVFKFKALLKSDAIKQVALDEVRLAYSPGRVVVTVPNGQEVGNDAWLIGVPYTIKWISVGGVSTKMKLEYSLNSGATWTTIATNVANVAGTNTYSYWTTPPTESSQCRVQVTDMSDSTITDRSDSDFSLLERFRVLVPNGGEKWYIGWSNTVVWASAVNLGRLTIDYAADGVNYNYNVVYNLQNTAGSASNQFVWATPLGNPALLSENGKMRIKTIGNTGTDESDNTFVLAGVEIVNPQVGSAVKRGGLLNIRWVSAGAGTSVGIDFSSNSGTTWTNVVSTAPNVVGSNVYAWAANTPPTDTAQLRIRSLSDTNVVGRSAVFTLADIDMTAPSAGTNWLMSTTNTIQWTSGGAGDKVNIYWSIDSGVNWTPIIANYTNASGPNAYNWVVHRFPVPTARIKVESVKDPENLWASSPDFNVAGVRVFNPTENWLKDVQNAVQWAYQSVGQNCTIQFSYDGGVTYSTIGGPGVGLSDRAYVYTPTRPTSKAKAKVMADAPSPYTNVFDESDGFFTVAGISVTAPTSGVAFTIGTANTIGWTSAGSEDPLNQARLYYTAGTETNLIATVGNNQADLGGNTYLWNILPGVTPSASARIIVKSGAYTGTSDSFILRGIKFTAPVAGTVFDIGANAALTWVYAGLDASAAGNFYLSTDGGNTFAPAPINAADLWSVQAKAYGWVISHATIPTTNAVLKFRVTDSLKTEDIGFEALSQPFTIRGFNVVIPNTGTAWALGQTNQIVWLSAKGGTYANLYYAPDGVTYDVARPITENVTLAEGTNRYAWGIESFRLPSTNASVKVVSILASAESALFRLNGLRVTAPVSSDVWAKDETNRIVWAAVGAVGTYTVSLVKDGITVLPIASGVTTPYYDWVVPAEAVSSNAYIRVQDSSILSGRSDTFRIVGEPTIGIMSPAPGEFWKVSQTYAIQWSKGGKMDNDFRVQYSTEPFVVTNEIFGVVSLDTTNNIYSIPWTVPDRLGATIILIQNNVRPSVQDVSAPFYVVGLYTVLSPNGGETSIYALKPMTLSWFTRGTVPLVNLYYSTAPLHGASSWVKINSTPVPNNGGGVSDQLTTYDWTTANLESSTVRVRVEQADRPGAYDDSDADFAIRYYEILWHVFDSVSSNSMDKLSVSDSSGWSASDLADPITHRYPYGTFNTVWSRENFFNNVVFDWKAEPSRTINVPMKQSEVEPDYNVLANFIYDASNAQFRVSSWLQRRGKVLSDAKTSTVSVYNINGALVYQVTSTSPDANGVFWQSLVSSALDRGLVYFAKVEIIYSGVTYSSGVTFNLRVPTDAEQAQLMMNALTNIEGIVSRVDTNLIDLATAQAIFRASAGAKLDSLTNSAEVIKAGLTNLEVKIDLLSTQAISRLDLLTNAVGVIGAGDTNNLVEMVKSLVSGGATREARILTRPTSVKWGSSVNVLYRSKEGLTASYTVLTAAGVATGASGPMTGAGGIYDAALTANWGYGDFQIVCSDNAGSSDRMIIKVTVSELDDLALTMGTVSGSLARVEFTLTNLVTTVSNVNSLVAGTTNNINSLLVDVSNITVLVSGSATNINSLMVNVSNMTTVVGTLAELTNMNAQVAVMTNSIAKIAGLTNLPAQMNYLTNVIVQLTPLTNMAPMLLALAPITNFAPQMNYMTNLMTQLAPMTNFATQLNYVTNIVSQLTGITNIGAQVAQMTNAVGQLTVLTNLMPQTAYLTNIVGKLSGLTNMPSQLVGLTNMPAQLASLTNLPAEMANVTTAIGQLGSLTNLGPQVDQLTIAMAEIAGLTNISDRMDSVVMAIGQLGSLTNLGPQVDQLTTAMAEIAGLTNLSSRMDSVVTAVGQLGSLTNLGSQVDSLNAAMGQIVGLTNMAGQVNNLTTTLNEMTNLNAKVDGVVGMIGQIASVTNMIGTLDSVVIAMNQLGSLTNLGSQVDSLNAAMGQIVGLTNMAGQVNTLTTTLTNMSTTLDSVSGAIGQLGSLTNLGSQVDSLNAAMGQIVGLTNMAGQVNAISTTLDGMTNLNTKVDQISDVMGQVVTLTNMVGTLNSVMSAIGQLGSLTNLGPQVDALNGAIGEIMALTNLASQVDGVATGVTGLESTVGTMSNTLASLNAAFLAFQTMSNSLSGVSALAPEMASISATVSNLQNSMTPMSESIAGVSSNIQTSLSPMQASLASLTGGLGTASDAAGKETLFGYIFELEKNLNAVGSTAQQAVSRAGGARSQANSAAGAAARIKNAVATGQIPQVMTDLAIIRKSLEETLSQVKGIPGQMSTEELVKTVNDAASVMKKMAAGRGVATPLGAEAQAQSGSTGSLQAGSLTDPKAVGELLNKLAETKAMMEATRLLMDEAINKPVVVDWLEGTQ